MTSMISKILHPTDFSKASQAALPLLLDLADHYGAEIHVLHAVDVQSDFFMEDGYTIPLLVSRSTRSSCSNPLRSNSNNSFENTCPAGRIPSSEWS